MNMETGGKQIGLRATPPTAKSKCGGREKGKKARQSLVKGLSRGGGKGTGSNA